MAQAGGLAFLVVALASACTTSTASTPTPVSPLTAVDTGEIGEEKENDGISVTIVRTRRLIAGDICSIALSADFDLCHTYTGPDDDVVIVETVVGNQTGRALDLSCLDEIQDALLDDEGNPFPSTGRLDLIVNNPRCGELLEPGQEHPIFYAYQLPRAARFTAWTFNNSSNPDGLSTTFVIADSPTISNR